MVIFLTIDNLSRHTQYHDDLNVKRDFVQEYLDALSQTPEPVPGAPFWDHPALEASDEERQQQSSSSKQKHGGHRHHNNQHHRSHSHSNQKRENRSLRHQQAIQSPAGESPSRLDLPTTNKRKKDDVSPQIGLGNDMNLFTPKSNNHKSTSCSLGSPEFTTSRKENSPSSRQKNATQRMKQEEQKSKRRKKHASTDDSEMNTVAQEIQRLDVRQSASSKQTTPGRHDANASNEGRNQRARTTHQDNPKNHKISKVVVVPTDANTKKRGLRHSSSTVEGQQTLPSEPPYLDSGQYAYSRQQKERQQPLTVQQPLYQNHVDSRRLPCNTTRTRQEINFDGSEVLDGENKASSCASTEYQGRRGVKGASKPRKVLTSGSLLMNQFTAPGISSNRLTLSEKRNDRLGMFKKGKASTKVSVPREFVESEFLGRSPPGADSSLREIWHKDPHTAATSTEQVTSIFFGNLQEKSQQQQQPHYDTQKATQDTPQRFDLENGYPRHHHIREILQPEATAREHQLLRTPNGSRTSPASHNPAVPIQQCSTTGPNWILQGDLRQGTDAHYRQTTPEEVVDEILDELKRGLHLTSPSPTHQEEYLQTSNIIQPISNVPPYTMHLPVAIPMTYVTHASFYNQPPMQLTPAPCPEYPWIQQALPPFDCNGGPITMLSPVMREEQPAFTHLYADQLWMPEPVCTMGGMYYQQESMVDALAFQHYQSYTPPAPPPPPSPQYPAGLCARDTLNYNFLDARAASPINPFSLPQYRPEFATSFGGPYEWRTTYAPHI